MKKSVIITIVVIGLFIIFVGPLGGIRGVIGEEAYENLYHEQAKQDAIDAEREACESGKEYGVGEHIVKKEYKRETETIETSPGYEIMDIKQTSNAWMGNISTVFYKNTKDVLVKGEYHEDYIDKCNYNTFGIVKE